MIKLGVYKDVTDGYRWRRLGFYEIDRLWNQEDINKIRYSMHKAKSSFVCYNTSSDGLHIVGLSPLNTITYAYLYKDLDTDLKGNCSGSVIRCNKKPHEIQELLSWGYLFPVVDQLSSLYERRFNIRFPFKEKWKSLFHIYEDQPLPYRLKPFQRRMQPWQLVKKNDSVESPQGSQGQGYYSYD